MGLASVRNITQRKFERVLHDKRATFMRSSPKGIVKILKSSLYTRMEKARDKQLSSNKYYPTLVYLDGFLYERVTPKGEYSKFIRTKVNEVVVLQKDYGYFDTNREEYGV